MAATPPAESKKTQVRRTMSLGGFSRRSIAATAFLAAVAPSACGDEESERPAQAPEVRAQTSPRTGPGTSARPAPARDAPDATRLRITFGDTELTARLDDNATARDLAAQLPLTLTFRDHNGVEKTAPLPSELSTEGAPDAHDPVAGDLGYFTPGGDLVLYHDDDASEFPGIVRIGRLDGDLNALVRQADELEATVDLWE
jgi:hypothetical protein